MSRTYRVRPNPVGSFFGGLAGTGILYFGLSHMGSDGGGFMVLWTVVGIGITLVSFYNAFSKRGIATNIAQDDGPEVSDAHSQPDAAARLRRLDDLRREGLITVGEYDGRRAEILRQL